MTLHGHHFEVEITLDGEQNNTEEVRYMAMGLLNLLLSALLHLHVISGDTRGHKKWKLDCKDSMMQLSCGHHP